MWLAGRRRTRGEGRGTRHEIKDKRDEGRESRDEKKDDRREFSWLNSRYDPRLFRNAVGEEVGH